MFRLTPRSTRPGTLFPYPSLFRSVGFVNGLPLVVIELKKPGVPARAAFDENLTHYKQQVPQLFWCNALLIASNGSDSRVGSLNAQWGRFFRSEEHTSELQYLMRISYAVFCSKKQKQNTNYPT